MLKHWWNVPSHCYAGALSLATHMLETFRTLFLFGEIGFATYDVSEGVQSAVLVG